MPLSNSLFVIAVIIFILSLKITYKCWQVLLDLRGGLPDLLLEDQLLFPLEVQGSTGLGDHHASAEHGGGGIVIQKWLGVKYWISKYLLSNYS